MKNPTVYSVFSIFFLFLFFPNTFSQNWIQSFNIAGSDIEPKFSAIDNQNSVAILSSFKDTIYNPLIISYGNRDLLISKVNTNGSILWQNHIGGINLDVAGGVCIDNSNNIYVAGYFYNANFIVDVSTTLINSGSADIFLLKYSSEGVLIWAENIGRSSTVQGNLDIKYDGASNIILAGFFKDSLIIGDQTIVSDTLLGNGFNNIFTAKYNLDGNYIFSKQIKGDNNLSRIIKIAISENGYYFGGYFQGNLFFDIATISSYTPAAFDAFIYKTDFNGNGQWVRRIRGQNTENFRTLATDEYDNVYVLGNYNSPVIYVDSTATNTVTFTGNSGGYDTFIGKYNRSGILQWFLRKGSTAKDIYNDFVVHNNVIYATGYFANQIIFNNDTLRTSGAANEDAFLAAFNEIGDPIAGVSILGTGNYNDAGTIVNMGSASRAYVAGYYKSQEIKIGTQTYTSNNVNKSDLFFAIYQHPFTAVITEQQNVTCHGLTDGLLRATPYFGKPPYTYSWSHNPSLNQAVATNLSPGTYTVTITDNNNQHASIPATISQPDTIEITGIITPVACYNGGDGAVDITVTGGTKATDYHYYWNSLDGSGITPLDQNQAGLTNGTYTVTVKDDNNCTVSQDFLVPQPVPFNYSGTVITDISPGIDGAIALSVSGGNAPYTFEWTGPGTFTASTEDISPLTVGGLYNLSITDDKDCTADTGFVVNDGIVFIAQVTSKTDVLCYGDNNGTATVTTLNGVAPFTYEWNDGVTLNQPTRISMPPGDYTVLVRDNSSRVASAGITIIGPLSGLTPVLDPKDPFCYHDYSGVVDLIITGGTTPYSFSWSNGYTGEDLVNIGGGTYTVLITDANDCFIQPPSVVLTEPDILAVEIALTGQVLCYGDKSVTATANITSGTGSFSYLWDDPGAQITNPANELEAGTVSVKVTNEKGCFITASATIPGPDSLSVQVTLNNPSCPGLADGSIIPTPVGGTPPYQNFNWSNGVYTLFNTDIPAGTYTLTFNDANYCTHVQDFTLEDPDTVKIASVDVTDLTCSGHDDGSITISATGGTGTYEYSNDGGANFVTTAIIGSLAEGEYTVVVKDGNECYSEEYPVTLIKSETCALIIYDAFSPNADGKNDVWNIGNIENFPACNVKIFNLWGIIVFSSNGYGTPWDGKYNGNELPSGTYYYVIDPGDGSKVVNGPVNIVK